jgi:hypothetical protein
MISKLKIQSEFWVLFDLIVYSQEKLLKFTFILNDIVYFPDDFYLTNWIRPEFTTNQHVLVVFVEKNTIIARIVQFK